MTELLIVQINEDLLYMNVWMSCVACMQMVYEITVKEDSS